MVFEKNKTWTMKNLATSVLFILLGAALIWFFDKYYLGLFFAGCGTIGFIVMAKFLFVKDAELHITENGIFEKSYCEQMIPWSEIKSLDFQNFKDFKGTFINIALKDANVFSLKSDGSEKVRTSNGYKDIGLSLIPYSDNLDNIKIEVLKYHGN